MVINIIFYPDRKIMPKGIYEHKEHSRITKDELKRFVRFCFREDIAEQLAKDKKPHILAVKLYFKETGIPFSSQTAKLQEGKWMMINDELIEVRQRKQIGYHKRITKDELKAFVHFCFRDDIAELIGDDVHSYKRASDLYLEHTGNYISPNTVRDQRHRWSIVNDICVKV